MAQYNLQDFRAGQRIRLNYSKDIYLLLSNKNLVNMTNGTIHKHIAESIWDVKSVTDNKDNLIAIRRGNILVRYNPIKHDKDIAQMKLLNNLLTFDEMNYRLVNEKIFLHWVMIEYQKVQHTKMRLGLEMRNFVTYQGEVHLESNNKQCTITKIEVDKKQEIFLYRYNISDAIYTLF